MSPLMARENPWNAHMQLFNNPKSAASDFSKSGLKITKTFITLELAQSLLQAKLRATFMTSLQNTGDLKFLLDSHQLFSDSLFQFKHIKFYNFIQKLNIYM